MITRTYNYNYVTDQYDVLDVETTEDGKRHIVYSRTMDLYFGKTDIPPVSRKENNEQRI